MIYRCIRIVSLILIGALIGFLLGYLFIQVIPYNQRLNEQASMCVDNIEKMVFTNDSTEGLHGFVTTISHADDWTLGRIKGLYLAYQPTSRVILLMQIKKSCLGITDKELQKWNEDKVDIEIP